MQKRGMLGLKIVLEIVLGVSVVFTLFMAAKTLSDQDYYIHQQIAQEGALLIDQFAGIKGNAYVKYHTDSKYKVALTENLFQVSHPFQTMSMPFAAGNTINIKQLEKPPLYFYKDGSDVSIANEVPEIKKFPCTKIMFSRPVMYVTDETKQIAEERLRFKCAGNRCTRGDNDFDFTISLKSAEEGVTVRYIKNDKSKAATCTILNEIQRRDSSISLWMLPADDINAEYGIIIETHLSNEEIVQHALELVIS